MNRVPAPPRIDDAMVQVGCPRRGNWPPHHAPIRLVRPLQLETYCRAAFCRGESWTAIPKGFLSPKLGIYRFGTVGLCQDAVQKEGRRGSAIYLTGKVN